MQLWVSPSQLRTLCLFSQSWAVPWFPSRALSSRSWSCWGWQVTLALQQPGHIWDVGTSISRLLGITQICKCLCTRIQVMPCSQGSRSGKRCATCPNQSIQVTAYKVKGFYLFILMFTFRPSCCKQSHQHCCHYSRVQLSSLRKGSFQVGVHSVVLSYTCGTIQARSGHRCTTSRDLDKRKFGQLLRDMFLWNLRYSRIISSIILNHPQTIFMFEAFCSMLPSWS